MQRDASGERRRNVSLPLWLRDALGAVYGYSVFLVVLVPLYVVVALAADYVVNQGRSSGPVPWLHTAAVPAIFAVGLAGLALALAAEIWLLVRGLRAIRSTLARTFGGRWTDGAVRALHVEEDAGDNDARYVWRVEFTDQFGRLHDTGYSTFSFSRDQAAPGTVLRVRHQLSDPDNATAIRPGVGPWISERLTAVVGLVLWAFFVGYLPVVACVAGIRWLLGHV